MEALNDTLRFKILKQLDQRYDSIPRSYIDNTNLLARNRLDDKQAAELKTLITFVPRMVHILEKSENEKKERLALEKKKERATDASKTVKSSRKRPDIGEMDDFAEFIGKAEADASSEDTICEGDADVKIPMKETKKQVRLTESDDDHSSISSHEA